MNRQPQSTQPVGRRRTTPLLVVAVVFATVVVAAVALTDQFSSRHFSRGSREIGGATKSG
jgi:hypothetical protein